MYTDLFGEARTGTYGRLDDARVVMEMAEASGLPLVSQEKRDPRVTTSYGTGEMIRDALDRGFTDISIAIGGSATNDGGMGCMSALGVRFLDENGDVLRGCGADLLRVRDRPVWHGSEGKELQIYGNVRCD